MKYTLARTNKYGDFISSEELKMNEDGEYNDIPERCPECNCVQDVNYKDFTCERVQVCEQCGNEMYLQS